MPGITKPVSRLLKLYGECTSELFKQFSNDFNPRAALQRNGGIWAGMQTIQQPAVNRNQTSSQQESEARLRVMLHNAGYTSPSSNKRRHSYATLRCIYIRLRELCGIGFLTFSTLYCQFSSFGPWTISKGYANNGQEKQGSCQAEIHCAHYCSALCSIFREQISHTVMAWLIPHQQ